MALYFRDFDKTRDWRVLVENLSLTAAGAILSFNPVSLYTGAKAAIRDSAPSPGTDEIAGIWLQVTATTALLDLLNAPEFGGPLTQDDDRKAQAKTFVTSHLTLDGTAEFTPAARDDPAGAPVLSQIVAALPELVPSVDADRARSAYAARLRKLSARVFALDPDLYGPLEAALGGAFSEGAQRDRAWMRHGLWVNGLFHSEPIFSTEEDELRPLAAVYHRQRCFWHVNEEGDTKAQPRFGDMAEERTRRTAHVADLHKTLHAWLNGPVRRDSIRLVAGGPGSGKSSASRAFAAEVLQAGRHRLIYIQLQHMRLTGDLYDGIGHYLNRRHNAQRPEGSAGFPDNPLDWMGNDTAPLLLIFDGLDELSHDDTTARDLARRFIANVMRLMTTLNSKCTDARALVLGRDAAVSDGLEEAQLARETLLHVAPLIPLEGDILGRPDSVTDPGSLAETDERPPFWRRATRAADDDPVSEAVTARELGDLNAEPLLLHLLIISGYAGATWREAGENRNRVYEAIFRKIHQRDQRKPNPPNQSEDDFFALMECLGLAAWRGAGRTGSTEEFATLRNLHCSPKQRTAFRNDPHAELDRVVVQTYTRRDLTDRGFEFIHKSFGEYLTARALLAAALRTARRMTHKDDPRDAPDVALDWTELIAQGDLTGEILRFLVDEARLQSPELARGALDPLVRLFNWTLANGMPAQKVAPQDCFRNLETRQRCAEAALVATIDALNRRRLEGVENPEPGAAALPVKWPSDDAPRLTLERLQVPSGHDIRNAIAFFDLESARLKWASLFRARLDGASLVEARLDGASLVEARLDGASLDGARLDGASLVEARLDGASLDGARLQSADLSDWSIVRTSLRSADLSASKHLDPASVKSAFGVASGIGRTLLPEGVDPPGHWHVAAQGEVDTVEAEAAYEAAYRGWLAELEESEEPR